MESFLNILMIAALLIVGFAIWQAWRIIRKAKDGETVSDRDQRKIDRWFTVVQLAVYVGVAAVAVKIYRMFTGA